MEEISKHKPRDSSPATRPRTAAHAVSTATSALSTLLDDYKDKLKDVQSQIVDREKSVRITLLLNLINDCKYVLEMKKLEVTH